jgi:hypothetical protein
MPRSVLTLVTYTAKPGCEEQLEGLLRTHIARLSELGLIAETKPHFAARKAGSTDTFFESFWWRDEGSKPMAEDNSEIQELWMRVEDLCTPNGVQHLELDPLV